MPLEILLSLLTLFVLWALYRVGRHALGPMLTDARAGSVQPRGPLSGRSAGVRPAGRSAGVAAIGALTVAALLALWAVASSGDFLPSYVLPSPLDALSGLGEPRMPEYVIASLTRMVGAMVVAVVVGVPVGLAVGRSDVGRGIFGPLLAFLRLVPSLAYLPLIVIWFGNGDAPMIGVIAAAMLAPVALSTAAGAGGSGAHGGDDVVGRALPFIVAGLRAALVPGWMTLIATELLSGLAGIGFVIQSAGYTFETRLVFTGLIMLTATAFALDLAMRLLERAVARKG